MKRIKEISASEWLTVVTNIFFGLSGVFIGEIVVHLFSNSYLGGNTSLVAFLGIGLLAIISFLIGIISILTGELFKSKI